MPRESQAENGSRVVPIYIHGKEKPFKRRPSTVVPYGQKGASDDYN